MEGPQFRNNDMMIELSDGWAIWYYFTIGRSLRLYWTVRWLAKGRVVPMRWPRHSLESFTPRESIPHLKFQIVTSVGRFRSQGQVDHEVCTMRFSLRHKMKQHDAVRDRRQFSLEKRRGNRCRENTGEEIRSASASLAHDTSEGSS
jgi:hypothetical protein